MANVHNLSCNGRVALFLYTLLLRRQGSEEELGCNVSIYINPSVRCNVPVEAHCGPGEDMHVSPHSAEP